MHAIRAAHVQRLLTSMEALLCFISGGPMTNDGFTHDRSKCCSGVNVLWKSHAARSARTLLCPSNTPVQRVSRVTYAHTVLQRAT